MNLLKHHIKEIHSISDITDRFIKRCGYEPNEALLEVDLTYDCYGVIKRKKETFFGKATLKRQGNVVILWDRK